MEIMYSSDIDNKYFVNHNFIGFYGEISDLSFLLNDVNDFTLKGTSKVKKYLAYHEEYFKILNLDKDILNKKISNLSSSEEKIIKLIYLVQNHPKLIILNYFDLGINTKYKSKISRLIKTINVNEDINFIIISNDLIFINKCVKHIIIVQRGIIKYQGDIMSAIKSGFIDKPPIINFIDKANKKGAKLDYTLDSKELLKAIYRSLF